jgi:hypothetical protein
MIDKLFPVFMLLGFLSVCAAIKSSFAFYARYRNRMEAHRRIPAIAFALAVFICGAVAGYLGMVFGIAQACSGPKAANMCWVWGFFVTGPIGLAVGIVAVGLALSIVRPVSE